MARTKQEIKSHKAAKITSWSILGGMGGFLALLCVISVIPLLNKSGNNSDNGIVKVTDPIEQTRRNQISGSAQPVSPKIEPVDVGENISPDTVVPVTEYAAFWGQLAVIAANEGALTTEARMAFSVAFLSRFGFWADKDGGMVFVRDSQVPVSPETLDCYIIAYVPGKNYIKPNCPSA